VFRETGSEFVSRGIGTATGIGVGLVSGATLEKSLSTRLSKIGSLRSKPITMFEKGRGTVKGAIVEDFPSISYFKSGKIVGKEQQVTSQLLESTDDFTRYGQKVYVERVKAFDIKSPSTYLDALRGKKPGQIKKQYFAETTDLILKDTPSQFAGPELARELAGTEQYIASVSPQRLPFSRGLLDESQFEVLSQSGARAERMFAEGSELDFFFAPGATKGTAYLSDTGKLKLIRRTQDILPDVSPAQRKVLDILDEEGVGGSFALKTSYPDLPRTFKDLDIISPDPEETIKKIKDVLPGAEFKKGTVGKYSVTYKGEDFADIVPQDLYNKYTKVRSPFKEVDGVKVLKEKVALKGKVDTVSFGTSK
jgi:hypothetical protein